MNIPKRWIFGVAILGIVLAVFLYPSMVLFRTWFDQRNDMAAARAELVKLDAQLASLDERIAAWDSPEEIERIARRDFGYVRPGEEAYRILPNPAPPVSIPQGWPFSSQ